MQADRAFLHRFGLLRIRVRAWGRTKTPSQHPQYYETTQPALLVIPQSPLQKIQTSWSRKFPFSSKSLGAQNQFKMGAFHVLEAFLPLGIIAGFLCVMGNAQYYIHRAAHGRVKIFPFFFFFFLFWWKSWSFCWFLRLLSAEAHRERCLGFGDGAEGQEYRGEPLYCGELGQFF